MEKIEITYRHGQMLAEIDVGSIIPTFDYVTTVSGDGEYTTERVVSEEFLARVGGRNLVQEDPEVFEIYAQTEIKRIIAEGISAPISAFGHLFSCDADARQNIIAMTTQALLISGEEAADWEVIWTTEGLQAVSLNKVKMLQLAEKLRQRTLQLMELQRNSVGQVIQLIADNYDALEDVAVEDLELFWEHFLQFREIVKNCQAAKNQIVAAINGA